ncbi:MAG: hypothetical protein P1V36_10200, partial [Planctomycetota bacterium]|nr:hypothetical protein [Planctomycetota bacterium]
MARALGTILLCLILTTLGAAGGWYAAARGASAAAPAEPEDGEMEEPTGLSPQALKNLGVRVAPVKLATFVRTV